MPTTRLPEHLNRVPPAPNLRYYDYKRLAAELVPGPAAHDDSRRYSLTRAALAAASLVPIDGLEAEVHQELAKQAPAARGGQLVPFDLAKRDLTVGVAAAGGNLVGAQPLTIADALRQRSVIFAAGAQRVDLPGQNSATVAMSGVAAVWHDDETAAPATSDPTFASTALAPKMLSARVVMSRRLALQNPALADYLLARDLGAALAIALDAGAINGSGASGQPTGVLNNAGIGTFTGTSLNWAGALSAIRDLETAGGIFDPGSVCWAADLATAETLRGRLRTGATGAYVVDGDDENGWRVGPHRFFATTSVPASTIVVGDFSQLLVAVWRAIELTVNPYAGSTTGKITFQAWLSADVAAMHATAFTKATSVT